MSGRDLLKYLATTRLTRKHPKTIVPVNFTGSQKIMDLSNL